MTGISISKFLAVNKKEIKASIKFGTITKQCKGKGICSITTDGPDFHAQESNAAKAIIRITPNNKLTILLEKASMSKSTKEKHFNSAFFRVEEPFVVPQQILQSLQLDYYLIEEGNYRMQVDETHFRIIF